MKIIVGHIFPELLNLYGDYGNIATLSYRLRARGIEVQVNEYSADDEIDFDALDIVFIGGGGEREQKKACEILCSVKDKLIAYVESGGVVLAVCGGFEILGKWYKAEGKIIEGTGVLDITADESPLKMTGNILIESCDAQTDIVGFENHARAIDIGGHTPLGKVLKGFGNNGTDGLEGVVYKNVTATNIHGPLLPKNPVLADFIIKKAVLRKDEDFELLPIDDSDENRAHDYMVGRLLNK